MWKPRIYQRRYSLRKRDWILLTKDSNVDEFQHSAECGDLFSAVFLRSHSRNFRKLGERYPRVRENILQR